MLRASGSPWSDDREGLRLHQAGRNSHSSSSAAQAEELDPGASAPSGVLWDTTTGGGLNLEHFVRYQGFYSVLLAAVVACATVAYTCLTHKLVKSNQLAFDHISKESVRPNIQVLLRMPYDWVLVCDILNVGAGPAIDVNVTFRPARDGSGGKFPFKTVSISTLGNGLKYSDSAIEYEGFDFSDRLVNLSFSDTLGNRYESSLVLDSASVSHIGQMAVGEYQEELKRISKSLESMYKEIKKL